jgi:hypothetical protein
MSVFGFFKTVSPVLPGVDEPMSMTHSPNEQALQHYTTLRNELAELARERGGSLGAVKSALYDTLEPPLTDAQSGAILKLSEVEPDPESAFEHHLDGDPDDCTESELRSAVALDVLFRDVAEVV